MFTMKNRRKRHSFGGNETVGALEMAAGGTLFLEEIGDMPVSLQANLLQVLQNSERGEVARRTRIISATSKNIEELLETGQFLSALYYRLNVVELHVPPLRERQKDIVSLAECYLQQFNTVYALDRTFTPEVLDCFLQYEWPGNVSELRGVVESLVVSAQGIQIKVQDLPPRIANAEQRKTPCNTGKLSLKTAVEALQREMIAEAVAREGSLRKAAVSLGMDATTLSRLAKKLGVEP